MDPPRKRKRQITDSPSAGSDKIGAGVLRRIALKSPKEQDALPPVTARRSERIKTLKAGNTDPPDISKSTSVLARLSTSDSSNNLSTPENCCYRCRIRGGRAAYRCDILLKQQSCTLCLRENNGKCRRPTDEEALIIAARCPQCIKRGFKTCVGRPCRPCINEGRAETCGQPIYHEGPLSTHVTSHDTKTPEMIGAHPEPLVDPETRLMPGHAASINQVAQAEGAIIDDISMTDTDMHNTIEGVITSSLDPYLREINAALIEDAALDLPGSEETKATSLSALEEDQRSIGSNIHEAIRTKSSEHHAGATQDIPVRLSRHDTVDGVIVPMVGRPRRNVKKVSYMEDTTCYKPDSLDEMSVEEEVSEFSQSNSCASNQEQLESMVDGHSAASFHESTLEGTQPQYKRKANKAASRGIDLSLRPLHKLADIFADMAKNACSHGLLEALCRFKGPIKVGTMCSGTEAPLLVLDLLSEALANSGAPPIEFRHCFSAEIDGVKQGFIERNYQPSLLFRDIRDFLHANARVATTAYGAEVEIPIGLHILVAGFVCKDLSCLNLKKKSLQEDGESGDTWRAIYQYAKDHRPKVVILENVKNKAELWDSLVARWNEIGYEAAWLWCDTKAYYLPQTRERMYMIAIERDGFGQSVTAAATQWKVLMGVLQRRCSSPYEAFLGDRHLMLDLHRPRESEPDWSLCKLRYDHIRSVERLGILRPITQWSEDGSIGPPDFASRQWYLSQSSRVHDAIDVAHLQAAQKGYDSLYKMTIWDVSQNVDRFKGHLGILPCITPGGCDFASNQQKVLTGDQLLLLQGLPSDKLLFANETQDDLQDLAGNAMSTTVIGAALISAIISCLPNTPEDQERENEDTVQVPMQHASSLKKHSFNTITMKRLDSVINQPKYINMQELSREAFLSSRLCVCEGDKLLCGSQIHICSQCGHTACTRCAGNPKHEYAATIVDDERTQTPDVFKHKWKAQFPNQLRLVGFPDVHSMLPDRCLPDQDSTRFLTALLIFHRERQSFTLKDMRRHQNSWKLIYVSIQAHLEVQIGRAVEWSLFMECPPELPGNSSLRKLFELPVARAVSRDSWLDLEWELRLPSFASCTLSVRKSQASAASWRNRLGLLDFQDETMPFSLQLDSAPGEFHALIGQYNLLPDCGTASCCLYKRPVEPHLYLFLDPHLIGDPKDDSFVFSYDCNQKQYREARPILAHVKPSWRPWSKSADPGDEKIKVSSLYKWHPVDFKLEAVQAFVEIMVPVSPELISDCSKPTTILNIQIPEHVEKQDFKYCFWNLEHTNCLDIFSAWRQCQHVASESCSCSPVYPQILWHVNHRGMATPHEDRKGAASFERAIKTRSPIFETKVASNVKSRTRIEVGFNVSALVHRVMGRVKTADSVSTAWRLLTDHADLPPAPLRQFHLTDNAHENVAAMPMAISYLCNAQPKAWSWMKSQEIGKVITITEIEEAIHDDLNWRAEARADYCLTIRGGVLADLPSFGKTVTTIALIQSEFEGHSPYDIIAQNRLLGSKMALLDCAATLIVCPPHIVLQWKSELLKFVGEEKYSDYNVLSIDCFDQLQALEIDDVCKSKVIIVSWSLFAEDQYTTYLSNFTGMPEPLKTGRRAYDTWMTHTMHEVPNQVSKLNNTSFELFQESTKQKLESRLAQQNFRMTLPLRVQHGSSYESFKAMQKAKSKVKMPKSNSLLKKGSDSKSPKRQLPLLHTIHFNRVVIDEYHYLNDDKKIENVLASVSVKHISATKRWVLSGTPALDSFNDVNQMASYLGIRLGRHHPDNQASSKQFDKVSKGDQTLVEDFLAKIETKSRQWHEARHERAQGFLDLFVRQNKPCLEQIPCSEYLVPIDLSIAHHSVYLELAQHLNAQRIQIRKIYRKANNDKSERLYQSLNNSATPEDALLKSALLFRNADGESELDALMRKRLDQCNSTQAELLNLIRGFEGLKKSDEIFELYNHFVQDIRKLNWLGDSDASHIARTLLDEAMAKPDTSAFPDLRKKGVSSEARNKVAKQLLSQLRETSRELVVRVRSARFITTIQSYFEPLQSLTPNQNFSCSSLQCKADVRIDQLYLMANCGHTACEDCLARRVDQDSCIQTQCHLAVKKTSFIRIQDLATARRSATEECFGRKLDAIAELILGISDDDQFLIFAPNNETMEVLEEVLNHHSIGFYSLRGRRAGQAARAIEDFKDTSDPAKRRRALIMNLGSEASAGVNLVNANRIIFVAPLLAKTQYEYDSAMAQATARSRRYGQTKRVHVYHFAALRTIDVDILEHRHQRNDGMTTDGSLFKIPGAGDKKERTRLVKMENGEMALVPASWLSDASKREMLGVSDMQMFTSLIGLSDTFSRDGVSRM